MNRRDKSILLSYAKDLTERDIERHELSKEYVLEMVQYYLEGLSGILLGRSTVDEQIAKALKREPEFFEAKIKEHWEVMLPMLVKRWVEKESEETFVRGLMETMKWPE